MRKLQKRVTCLTSANIDSEVRRFRRMISDVGHSIAGKRGIDFFESLKRDPISAGPYQGITLYEASNRIMTDLVILCGVRWLLKCPALPYMEYEVDYGNDNKNAFDITAEHEDGCFSGEAFNVAPSYFGQKCKKELDKLRARGNKSKYRAIIVNEDALSEDEIPAVNESEFFILVSVRSGKARSAPNNALHGTR
jgi:hypothetical protein